MNQTINMSRKYQLKLIYQLIRGIINPNDVSNAVKIGDIINHSGVIKHTLDKIRTFPGGAQFLKDKKINITYDPGRLSKCPIGSLGRVYYDHLQKYKIDPLSFPDTPVVDEGSYLEQLVRKSHDLWHVILDFDTSVPGEMGVQAFMNQQMAWPFSMVGFGGGAIVTLLKESYNMQSFVSEIARGYELGKLYKPLIMVHWDELYDLPFDEVIKNLKVNSASKTELKNNYLNS